MKRTPGMGIEPEHPKLKLPKIDCHDTTSTLNGDESDKGIQQGENKKVTVKDAVDEAITLTKSLDSGKCAETSFEDQFTSLSRPFRYLTSINAKDQKSKFDRMNGFLKKNITNNIWAVALAQEIQHILICEIKHKTPAVRTRDDLIVSSTKYMAQIFEQILNLFETNDYNAKYDIEGLFELLIENIYRLDGTVTPTFQETISLDDTRKILRKYKDWVIELRSKIFNIA